MNKSKKRFFAAVIAVTLLFAAIPARAEEIVIDDVTEEIKEIEVSAETDEIEDASESENMKSILNTSLTSTSSVETASLETGSIKGYSGNINLVVGSATHHQYRDLVTLNSDVNKIIRKINPSWSDFQKIVYVYDWVRKNCAFDELAENNHSAYSAIHNGLAVCDGYSRAFKYILNKLDIECEIVLSADSDHAWTIVKLDGKWYYADIEGDDSSNATGNDSSDLTAPLYHGFLRSKELFENFDTDDWTIESSGENIYNNDSICTESYDMQSKLGLERNTTCSSDGHIDGYFDKSSGTWKYVSDVICEDYTDGDYDAKKYEEYFDCDEDIDITCENRNYNVDAFGISVNIKNKECNDNTSFDIWTHEDSDRMLAGIAGYDDENKTLDVITILREPESTAHGYSMYKPQHETIDISKYISSHTVKFDSNGGSYTPDDITVPYGDTFTLPEAPEKEHYTFDGWYNSLYDVYYGKSGKSFEVKEDMTYYAKWYADFDCTLTLDPNNGSAVETKYLKISDGIEKPADPVRDGYTFKGWYVNDDTSEHIRKTFCGSTGKKVKNWGNALHVYNINVTFHAEWEKNADETPSEEAPSEEQPSEETPSEETPSEETHEKETVDPTLKTVTLINGAGLTYKAEMPYTRVKSSIVSNANVKLTFAKNDENAGKIYVKKVTAKKPKKNATSTTIKVVLKGSDKASKKLAKQMNKQLKKLSVTLTTAE